MTATALAAVAAIGGLWAQAVTTYWSQQTAKDQLQQSRQEGEKAERAQAETVSAWIEGSPRFWQVHVLNRSSDPVPRILVGLTGTVQFGDSVQASAVFEVSTSRLAPCTELIFSPDQLSDRWMPRGGGEMRTIDGGAAFVDFIAATTFVDRDGRSWVRTGNGRLSRESGINVDGEWYNRLGDNPAVKKAASCGENK
ncbi:hypothetical protein [Streptomyces sp. NPDC057301]|uniref:hypothetical protein n=1 Tax=Streptomyces sp. NPDC057301 TaxID=3346093 RepID=UPI003640122D